MSRNYNATGKPGFNSAGQSQEIRQEFAAIQAGFAGLEAELDSTAPSSVTLASKADKNNPTFTGTVTGVTKAMVGLPNVDNTSDASKPISTPQQNALNAKLNKNLPDGNGSGKFGQITAYITGVDDFGDDIWGITITTVP